MEGQGPGLLRQFLMGAGAQGCQRLVVIGAQLVVVPVMLQGWGAAGYGGWVALDSVRAILAMSDLGLAQAAANRMTAEIAAGDQAAAARTGTAAWTALALAALAVGLLGGAAALFLPFDSLLNLDRPAGEAGLAFFLLSLVAAGGILFGAVGGGLRAAGLFWLMSLAQALFHLAGAAAMAACALRGTGYVALAAALAAAQALTLGPVALWFLWRHPWARPRAAADGGARLRQMLAPSLASLLYTLSGLLTIQGINILVAATLGPAAVAALSAIRTLTRLGRAAAAIAVYPLEPVFARLQGAGAAEAAGALSRRLAQGGAALALAYGLPMAAFGPAFLSWWTGGRVTGHDGLHHLMTAAVAAEILWFALQTRDVATNRHLGHALWLAGAGLATTLLCALLLPVIGLAAAGWTLLALQGIVLAETLGRRRFPSPSLPRLS